MAPENQPVTPDPSTAVPAAMPASATPDQMVSNPTPQSVPQPNATDANAPAYTPGSNVSSATGQQVPQNAAPAAPVPHARLLAMVRGLSAGLETAGATMSAVGKSIATHGKEGGAQDVEDFNAKQQQMKLQTQQAAIAAKDADLRQQLMVGQIAETQGNIARLNGTLKSDLTKADAEAKGAQQTVIGQAQDIRTKALQDFMMTGDLAAYNDTLSKLGGTAAPTGTAPAAGGAGGTVTGGSTTAAGGTSSAGGIPPVAVASWKNSVDAASNAYPNDPTIKQYAAIMTDPNADPKQMASAANGAKQRMAALDSGVESRTKQAGATKAVNDANPLFKFESDPKALSDPGAQATLKAYIDDPANANNLNGLAQAKTLITKAGIAQAHDIALAGQKSAAMKTAEQNAAAGNPADAGRNLATGLLTLADLKSRGSTQKQINDASDAAVAYGKAHGFTYNPSDEIVGEHTLQNASTQTFFGSARSLTQRGGMLDMLKQTHDSLGNQEIPKFNSIIDWTNYQAGTPELAAYRSAVLGAADDYAKVMGGGNPSDTRFIATENSFLANMNNKQFDAAVKTSKDAVRSQVQGRIGSNRYIAQREGDMLSDHQVGDTVTLKDGSKVVIKSIDPITQIITY